MAETLCLHIELPTSESTYDKEGGTTQKLIKPPPPMQWAPFVVNDAKTRRWSDRSFLACDVSNTNQSK